MSAETFTDPRDGNTYRTVQIGAQRWLAENLKYLPSVCPATEMPDGAARHYVYDYQGSGVGAAKTIATYQNYGVLYNWPAALQACPPGWHLPSDDEWTLLTNYLIQTCGYTPQNVGFALKSCRQVDSPLGADCNTEEHPRWEKFSRPARQGISALRRKLLRGLTGPTPGHGTDEFGFAALPGGRCSYGGFYRLGSLGYWWSATPASELRIWARQMTISGSVNRWDMSKDYGYSVRCIKD